MAILNYYYSDTIRDFLNKPSNEIIGKISSANEFDSVRLQIKAWEEQIQILKSSLKAFRGKIYFEFSIPRMGKRVDTIVIIENVVFVIEFKINEHKFLKNDVEQVWDYALDLKNFHKASHNLAMVPILVASNAQSPIIEVQMTSHNDSLALPILCNGKNLNEVFSCCLLFFNEYTSIDPAFFEQGVYSPTPTIIEAAISLYNTHSVSEITRSDADATNLSRTTHSISRIIENSKNSNKKAICFVTGVPGAGKTLVGLKVATMHLEAEKAAQSVYLSGNAPLVAILQEALARNKVKREHASGAKISKKEAKQAIKSFIQIIHHYRDAYIVDKSPPYDHVAIFDEAQRVWNKEQTVKFMTQKKGIRDFQFSEPEFFISCLNRHKDWAVIVCLVGGGQEINTGEAGISEWLNAVKDDFPNWDIFISPNLVDSEYSAIATINKLDQAERVKFDPDLHLSVSMRSYRAENVSQLVKHILDLDLSSANRVFRELSSNYPITLTRDLNVAKQWLKEKARGSERYGLVVSSQAQRLKPLAIDVKSPIDPVHWFLDDKDDVRSSYYLEDVATEFQVQGLELDWACVTWDGDLRYLENGWETFSFKGSKWQSINHPDRKRYLINAYRVLLTRARQGMAIVIPEGNPNDQTRLPEYYDSTYNYLAEIGFEQI